MSGLILEEMYEVFVGTNKTVRIAGFHCNMIWGDAGSVDFEHVIKSIT